MKNSIFIFSVGIAVSLFRIYMQYKPEEELIFVMAVINVIAFNYVILLIGTDTLELIKEKLNKSSLCFEQKDKYVKKVQYFIRLFYCLIFIGMSVGYILKIRSATWNDIISILALIVSISANDISSYMSEKIYTMI